MSTVHVPGEEDPNKMGDPAHFREVCRGYASTPVQVFLKEGIRGFAVPIDGIWMINGLFAMPGEVRDLLEGDRVTYHRTARPEHAEGVRRVPWRRLGDAATMVDPKTALRTGRAPQ